MSSSMHRTASAGQSVSRRMSARRRDALRHAVLHPCSRTAVLYQDADDYRRYVAAQYAHPARLMEKLNLRDQLKGI
jgi:hypothetical protein